MKPIRYCSIKGCDERCHGQGYCLLHYRRYFRHGDPLHVGQSDGGAGKPRKESVGYMAVHYRVRSAFGKASEHVCSCGCGEQAAQWAYDHTDPNETFETVRGSLVPFSQDLNKYKPMAVKCHREHDRAFLAQKVG